MPRLEAASISMTFMPPPLEASRQLAQTPQGWVVGPFTQLTQRARIGATVVLPVPRWPEKMYPWAMRRWLMALARVVRTCSWPISSENDCGRYLRAITWYDMPRRTRPRVIRGTRG